MDKNILVTYFNLYSRRQTPTICLGFSKRVQRAFKTVHERHSTADTVPNCQLMWKDDVSHGTFESANLVTNTSLFDDDDGSFIIFPQWIILRLSCILVIGFFCFSFHCYLLQSMVLIVALQSFHIHNMVWKGYHCLLSR